MIKLNELRFRNWVEREGEFLRICCIQSDNTIRLTKQFKSIGCFRTSTINPIPLTPEILEKAGFIKGQSKDIHDWWIKYTIPAKPNKLNSVTLEVGNEGKSFQFIHSGQVQCLQYLHDLQNLYHALTSEELNIELAHVRN